MRWFLPGAFLSALLLASVVSTAMACINDFAIRFAVPGHVPIANKKFRHFNNRFLRGRKPDALEPDRPHQRLKPLHRQGQVRTATVAHDSMNFIHN